MTRARTVGLAFLLLGCSVRLDDSPAPPSSGTAPAVAPACRLFSALPVDFVGGRVSSLALGEGATSWIVETVRAGSAVQSNIGVVTPAGVDPCQAGGAAPLSTVVGPSPRGAELSVQALAPVSFDGKRYLYYALYRPDSREAFGVALEGYGVAPFDEESGRFAPTDSLLWTADRPAFGSAALLDGSDVVVYGCSGGFPLEDCFIARVPKDDIEDESAYRYYSGGGHDSPLVDDASVAFTGGAPSVWRLADRGRVVAVYVTPLGDRLVARSGLTPVGPWSKPFDLARCEVPKDAFCTSPVIHAQPAATSLSVSYGVATFTPGALEAAPLDYFARLADVALPKALP